MRRRLIPILVLLIAAATLWQRGSGPSPPEPLAPQAAAPVAERTDLPAEAVATLDLVSRGGPFPYRKDGSVFGNRESRLPAAAAGFYREYTVPTPGAPDRGARRIITGGTPPRAWYYTDDHYRSFRAINPLEYSAP
ncbi:MAG: ribonuclease domain-containing protein [Gammaproteobacteria bacterium]